MEARVVKSAKGNSASQTTTNIYAKQQMGRQYLKHFLQTHAIFWLVEYQAFGRVEQRRFICTCGSASLAIAVVTILLAIGL